MAEDLATVHALTGARPDYEGRVGAFTVEVRKGADGGSLHLTPDDGAPLVLRIQGDVLELAYAGPTVRLTSPQADLELDAKNVSIRASETVSVHGGREVDVHSGEDVEIRADHQVNLWAHGVLVGD